MPADVDLRWPNPRTIEEAKGLALVGEKVIEPEHPSVFDSPSDPLLRRLHTEIAGRGLEEWLERPLPRSYVKIRNTDWPNGQRILRPGDDDLPADTIVAFTRGPQKNGHYFARGWIFAGEISEKKVAVWIYNPKIERQVPVFVIPNGQERDTRDLRDELDRRRTA